MQDHRTGINKQGWNSFHACTQYYNRKWIKQGFQHVYHELQNGHPTSAEHHGVRVWNWNGWAWNGMGLGNCTPPVLNMVLEYGIVVGELGMVWGWLTQLHPPVLNVSTLPKSCWCYLTPVNSSLPWGWGLLNSSLPWGWGLLNSAGTHSDYKGAVVCSTGFIQPPLQPVKVSSL